MKKTNPNSSSRDNSFERDQYLYLTTRGRKSGEPREIEIWFTHFDGRFFVVAEHQTSHWLQNLCACGEVRARVGGDNFARVPEWFPLKQKPSYMGRLLSHHERSTDGETA